MGDLLQRFLDGTRDAPEEAPTWRLEGDAAAQLEAALATVVESARATFPDFVGDGGDLVAHLARHLRPGDVDDVGRLQAGDLALAAACARGDDRAIAIFERTALEPARGSVARIAGSQVAVDEVLQAVRARLLVGDGTNPPRISQYGGRGALAAWVRVAAVRTGLDLKRARSSDDPTGEPLLDAVVAPDGDPEIDHLRAKYGVPLREAFRAALSDLRARERVVLRLSLVDGLNIDRIGALHGVHRATVARWIARARETLYEGTKRRLRRDLGLPESQFESVVGLVLSRLDVSIERLLADEGPPSSD
jgi:RNA polymerase sigma-70 factor (ECF subfamily)